MPNYVEIKTSIPDILNIANHLRTQGDQLTESMKQAVAAIDALDVSATFPPDEFTDPFLDKYHNQVPAGDGTTLPANMAVKQSATQLGTALTNIAGSVSQAMWSYLGTDEDSGKDIGSTVKK